MSEGSLLMLVPCNFGGAKKLSRATADSAPRLSKISGRPVPSGPVGRYRWRPQFTMRSMLSRTHTSSRDCTYSLHMYAPDPSQLKAAAMDRPTKDFRWSVSLGAADH